MSPVCRDTPRCAATVNSRRLTQYSSAQEPVSSRMLGSSSSLVQSLAQA
jgi:hypothetical protein